MHWCEPYIGEPYRHGVADCAALYVRVSREVFNRSVPDTVEVERAASRLGRAAQMGDGVETWGEPIDDPVEGDAVLMVCAGRPSHIGVFCRVDGEACVLHAMENAGQTVLHTLRSLDRHALRLEGFYRWKR